MISFPRWLLPAVVLACAAEIWFVGFRPSAAPPPPVPSSTIVPAAATHRLTAAFWNLQWFPGRVPQAGPAAQANHLAAVAPVLAQIDPDILGLEEVADRAAATLLADRLPGFHVDVCTEFLREPANEPSRQQIALCSRLPLLDAGWQSWAPDAHGHRPRRGFAFAVYRGAPDEVLLVYGLHLKSNVLDLPGGADANLAEREETARQLLVHERAQAAACAARWGRVRLVLIGGDMNTSLDDPRFAREKTLRSLLTGGAFRWAWRDIPLPARLTLPGTGFYPAACFDHVFYRGDDVHLLDATIRQTDHRASDHRPVTTRFEW